MNQETQQIKELCEECNNKENGGGCWMRKMAHHAGTPCIERCVYFDESIRWR